MSGISSFTIFDYIVVGSSLLLPLVIGLYYASNKQTSQSLFTGERSLNTLPVSISIMITYLSATTIADNATTVSQFGIEIVAIVFVMLVFTPLGACTFVPVMYDKNLTNVYEYMKSRFQSSTVKWLASLTFIIQQLVLTSISMFMLAIVAEEFIGLPIWSSIILVGVCGTLYTTLGGIKSIVWVETFQLVIILCALAAVVSKGILTAGGFTEIYQNTINYDFIPHINSSITFNPFLRHNFYNFLLWHGFYAFMLPGCDQLQIQRYSSLPKRKIALNSVLLTIPLKILVMILCFFAGLLVYSSQASEDAKYVEKVIWSNGKMISEFIMKELKFIPGMMGLFSATIFALTLSLFASPLNSISAVTWKEFSSFIWVDHMARMKHVTFSRSIQLFYGCLLTGLAISMEYIHPVFNVWNLTFGTISVTYSALAGLFILALFFPCTNKFGAVIGFLCGMASLVFLCVNEFYLNQPNPLTTFNRFSNGTMDHPALITKNNEWLEKLSLISYLLYPVIGTSVTIIVGLLISILTGGVCLWSKKSVNYEDLHPFLRCQCDCCSKEVEFESLNVSQRYADRISSAHNIYTAPVNNTTTLDRPPSYTYYQYSPVETQISRNEDDMYSEVITPSIITRSSAEYENI